MGNMDAKLENRLKKMVKIYNNLDKHIDELLDRFPDKMSSEVKDLIKNKIFNNAELKSLIDGIENNRPPRILLFGRTGIGKSSLINALCGTYASKVGEVRSCTSETSEYAIKEDGRVLMHIMDTRGIEESEDLDEKTAEDQLLEDMQRFYPDVIVFVLSATHRDGIKKDVVTLRNMKNKVYPKYSTENVPVVAVINKVDELEPSTAKDPICYPDNKKETIAEAEEHFSKIIKENGLDIKDIIAVSSLIEWKDKNGNVYIPKDMNKLSDEEREKLEISFDGRWQIKELRTILVDAIEDVTAKMGMRLALSAQELPKQLANNIINIFAGISALVGTTPIPFGDIYILCTIQAIMISIIAALSGRDIDFKAALEFLASLGGTVAVGLGLRLSVQQLSKIVNVFMPGAGSALSAGVAAAGTKVIGEAAVKCYIDGVDVKALSKQIKKDKKKAEKENKELIKEQKKAEKEKKKEEKMNNNKKEQQKDRVK